MTAKTKVLLVGPLFANAGHGAECGVYDALKELGCEVANLDCRVNQFVDLRGNIYTDIADICDPGLCMSEDYDIVLCLGAGVSPALYESGFLNSVKGKKILWNSEPIRLPVYRGKIEAQHEAFDLICTFDESEVPLYEEMGCKEVMFLPQAYNPEWYEVESDVTPRLGDIVADFIFVGSIGGKWINRQVFLSTINGICAKNAWSFAVQQTFDAKTVNKYYRNSKVVINLGLFLPELGPANKFRGHGLQQRIFEAAGAGRVCLTNEIAKGSNDIFTDHQDIVFYNEESLEWSMNYCMDHWEELSENVVAGRDKHNYAARMKTLLSHVKGMENA